MKQEVIGPLASYRNRNSQSKIVGIERRVYGAHLTSIEVFKKVILPEIKDRLYRYVWVDLFAGKGNLILPILELLPQKSREEFFQEHIYLFDVQKEMIEESIKNAMVYGIPKKIAEKNIILIDTIKEYPKFITKLGYPVYHITNPPYLYIGYIVKHRETQKYLEYFKDENEGYQDLYQLGLINDLRNNVKEMIYIIPSNFLFGYSVSNKIRDDFLKFYKIEKAIIFERRIFEYTGTNVAICFFKRKREPKKEKQSFEGTKINRGIVKRTYVLYPQNHYRAGNEFEEFVERFKSLKPLKFKYYLTLDDVGKNKGDKPLRVIDVNKFNGRGYEKTVIYVNDEMYKKIRANSLFVRTLDTGSMEGRVGLYIVPETFEVDGILVSENKYRTHPIQIFFKETLPDKDLYLLKDYFNLLLEHLREITDSEFMTTYKYSTAEYTRKYLGLSQAKSLIQTFPIKELNATERNELEKYLKKKNVDGIYSLLERKTGKRRLERWL